MPQRGLNRAPALAPQLRNRRLVWAGRSSAARRPPRSQAAASSGVSFVVGDHFRRRQRRLLGIEDPHILDGVDDHDPVAGYLHGPLRAVAARHRRFRIALRPCQQAQSTCRNQLLWLLGERHLEMTLAGARDDVAIVGDPRPMQGLRQLLVVRPAATATNGACAYPSVSATRTRSSPKRTRRAWPRPAVDRGRRATLRARPIFVREVDRELGPAGRFGIDARIIGVQQSRCRPRGTALTPHRTATRRTHSAVTIPDTGGIGELPA